jgi:tetratricopeptide (TPR) repeat protein
MRSAVGNDEGLAKTKRRGPALGSDLRINNLLISSWNALARNEIHAALDQTNQALSLSPNCAQALLFKGYCLYKLDKPNAAVEYIRRGVDADSTQSETALIAPGQDLAYVFAAALTQANRKEEAVTVLSKAIKANKSKSYLYGERANIYRMLGQPEKAFADYTAQINLGAPDGYENRATLYLEMKKPDLAIADLSRAISKQPANSNLYAIRSKCYSMIGQQDLSKKDKAKANALGADSLFVPYN